MTEPQQAFKGVGLINMPRRGDLDREGLSEIAYILKGYLRTSETFITNEIHLLEAMGLKLSIFSVKKLQGQKHHAILDSIRATVTYLPQATPLSESNFIKWLLQNLPKFARSHWRLFRSRPLAYLQVVSESLAMSLKYRSGVLAPPRTVFIKEFLQAGFIAQKTLESPRIRHLHAHFCHGATTIAMYASRLSDIPFSFTAHAKDIYLRELNPGDLLPLKMRRARFVVTCTGANQIHLDRCSTDGGPVHRIYHGLDISRFIPARREDDGEPKNGTPVVISVGRLVEKKGFDYLVEACRLLKDRGHDFHCHIVGGADKYSQTIECLINNLKLEDTVFLRGGVTQEQLRGIYQQGTVFALPCLVVENGDRDGIPNVLVEAMAMEMPVVSTDISGIPELVEHNVNGLLVPEKDATAIADAIEALLEDPDLRRRLGRAARERVCKHFNSRQTTVALRDLFLACLEESTVASNECYSTP